MKSLRVFGEPVGRTQPALSVSAVFQTGSPLTAMEAREVNASSAAGTADLDFAPGSYEAWLYSTTMGYESAFTRS